MMDFILFKYCKQQKYTKQWFLLIVKKAQDANDPKENPDKFHN